MKFKTPKLPPSFHSKGEININIFKTVILTGGFTDCFHKTTEGGMSVDTMAHWGTNDLVLLCPHSKLAGDESDPVWTPHSYSSMARAAAGKKGRWGSPALSGYTAFFTSKSVCMVTQWKSNKDPPFSWHHCFSRSQLWKTGLLREALAWAILLLLYIWLQ